MVVVGLNPKSAIRNPQSKGGKVMKKMLPVAVSMLILLLGWGPAWGADPIKLGAFFDLTGASSAIGTPTKLVAEMVVKKINGEGGINGRPLELVIADDEGDPTKAAIIAKKFIESDKVVAIIGPTRTDTGMAAKPTVEQMQGPHFHVRGRRSADYGETVPLDFQVTPENLGGGEEDL
jgi:branched-chain amino acid transport system substrate-binding protein